jgi:hypothetical protein
MVQQAMSVEKTPVLAGTIPCFEMFMTAWEHLRDTNSNLRSYITEGMTWAVKYYEKMDQTRAYIISMGK